MFGSNIVFSLGIALIAVIVVLLQQRLTFYCTRLTTDNPDPPFLTEVHPDTACTLSAKSKRFKIVINCRPYLAFTIH